MHLIFRNKIPCLLRPFKLALLAPGGLSDLNRYSVLAERFRIAASMFPYLYLPIFLCMFVIRILREIMAGSLKIILSTLLKLTFNRSRISADLDAL
jgi:hypothetical protein